MTEINRYALMMEALAELKPEIDSTRRTQQPVPDLPPLSEVLAEFGPMPTEALFLGVASDGLPVLFNLHDPVPGPILIGGDPGSGKTALLQIVASAAGKMHQPEDLQFGVLTNHPDEWSGVESIPNNVGIFPLYHKSAEDFILSLASWAHGNKTSQQSVLLLLDDLEAAIQSRFRCQAKPALAPAAWTCPPCLADHHLESQPDGKHHALAGCISYPCFWYDAGSKAHPATGRCQCGAGFAQQRDHILPYEKENTGFDFGYQA